VGGAPDGPGGASGVGGDLNASGQAGDADSTEAAGAGGAVQSAIAIAQPSLTTGKTFVDYASTVSASGGTHYTWSLASGALPAGLGLQNTTSADVKIAGAPSEAGLFPITLSVTDGSSSATVSLTLAVTHSVLFRSDRNATGVNELFLSDVGATTTPAPTRLSASFPTGGGVSSYTWSPDGSKVLYLASQSTGGAAELWVASVATPGSAKRVSAAGATVSQYAWLRAGNIGAYSTADGNTYLADLSGASPGTSQVVTLPTITGLTRNPGALYPSPNGKALMVVNIHAVSSAVPNSTVTYVSWANGAASSVVLVPADASGVPSTAFSFDGKAVVMSSAALGIAAWDLSVAPPARTGLANPLSPGGLSWAPSSEALLDVEADPAGNTYLADLRLRTLTAGGAWTNTLLVSQAACTPNNPGPWSPDGKNALFQCNVDLRGISDVTSAATGSDFSLLPSGFLQNAFTDIPSVSWSPDSRWVALRADRDVNAQYDFFLVRWSAPGVTYKPHASTIAPGVASWAFAQNSQAVAFVGTISPVANAGLYLTNLPSSGAPPLGTLVSAPSNAVVQNDIAWLPGSRVLVYRAAVSGATQLFAVPVAADGTAGTVTPISGVSGSGITSYSLAPSR
jgi:Putative Ig domain/WD40-like Beta Propeller Repeat